MKRINDVLIEIDNFVDEQTLEDFISREWVCPLRDETDYIFEDIDIARIRLVCELHIEMKIEADTVNIILSLIDQLHKSKTQFSNVMEAIQNQPEDIRNSIIQSIENGSA